MIQSFLGGLLITAILLGGMSIPVFSQEEKPVVISFGQPNIWSLEQAHYLLARMHRQNLDLQTAELGNLDPNETNASRIDILKTLIEAGVKFDDAVRLNNQMLRNDKVFNSQRRQELLTKRSSLQAESTQLAREIADLKIAKADAKTDEDRARIQAEIDAKTEQKAAVDNQIEQTNGELEGLSSASGDFKSVEASGEFDSTKLQGDLDAAIKKIELTNPSIAASLRLENHVQMQYEIIAKQLTLLRDEIGPGERLVFLELPQSINATQDKAANKMAQVWWRIAGYTRVDKESLFQKELENLAARINGLQDELNKNTELNIQFTQHWIELDKQLAELCAEQAKRAAEKEKEQDEEQCRKITYDLLQIENVIRDTKRAIQSIDDQRFKVESERAKLSQTFTALSTKYEKLKIEVVKRKIREQQNAADRLLQGGGANTSEIVTKTLDLISQQGGNSRFFKKENYGNFKDESGKEYTLNDQFQGAKAEGRQYVNLDPYPFASPANQQRMINGEALDGVNNAAVLRDRTVRTIDIIPRQNAVNVNDTKERVNKTGIFAAFSFLFGFGGKFGFERQHEQAERFLNQELFTSGFGKGETDFGWNFYPFAGTKQLAPGVRTTYAVAIIPEDAETLVLKARGCYFPRKENQPLNYDMAGSEKWTERNSSVGSCTPQEQVFVLPVPGGSGDGADYYVTELRYSSHRGPGERMVVSISGQNLPTQIGVLIDGVPLTQSVGLGQLGLESLLTDKVKDNCVGPICGRFERIDANQLVISFNMPKDFIGFPRIALIGPGKEIELNKLHLNINGVDDAQLEFSDDYMFGAKHDPPSRSIDDFKVVPAQSPGGMMTGVLSGGKFSDTDTIYVNGYPAKKSTRSPDATPESKCDRADLCILKFPAQGTDFLTVTISPEDEKEEAVSRTFVNPTTLSIISASIVSSQPGDDHHPAMLTVKLDGSGFKGTLDVSFDDTGTLQKKIVPSSGQMILEIAAPKSVVQIIIRDPDNNKSVSTVVVSPPKQSAKEQ